MKKTQLHLVLLALLLPLLSVVSCSKNSGPPPTLTAAELPAAMEKAFEKASPEAKELASQIVTAVQAKDFPKAYQNVQMLAGMPSLSKQQVSVASSAMATVNTLLQEAQAQGDAKAAQAIQIHRATK